MDWNIPACLDYYGQTNPYIPSISIVTVMLSYFWAAGIGFLGTTTTLVLCPVERARMSIVTDPSFGQDGDCKARYRVMLVHWNTRILYRCGRATLRFHASSKGSWSCGKECGLFIYRNIRDACETSLHDDWVENFGPFTLWMLFPDHDRIGSHCYSEVLQFTASAGYRFKACPMWSYQVGVVSASLALIQYLDMYLRKWW